MNRKEFLTSVSIIAAGSVAGSPLLSEKKDDYSPLLPIVDTHQHLVDFNRFGNDWSNPPVPGNFGMAEYKKAIKGLNIVKAVYMEVAVPEKKRYEEALYAMELCGDKFNPTVGAVIAGDLHRNDFREYVSQFKNDRCIKGIRAGFRSCESMQDSRLVDNIRFLGDIGMRLDFVIPPSLVPQYGKLDTNLPGHTIPGRSLRKR
jgi:L-fuconolactonase